MPQSGFVLILTHPLPPSDVRKLWKFKNLENYQIDTFYWEMSNLDQIEVKMMLKDISTFREDKLYFWNVHLTSSSSHYFYHCLNTFLEISNSIVQL